MGGRTLFRVPCVSLFAVRYFAVPKISATLELFHWRSNAISTGKAILEKNMSQTNKNDITYIGVLYTFFGRH
jgi:hypothetical protein